MLRILGAVAISISGLLMATPSPAQRSVDIRRSRSDLADFAEGTYFGDVISDSRGSSRSGVTVRVIKVGPNLVEIQSDYARIPTVRVPLEAAMSAVLAASGDHVFLINRDQDRNRLDLTIDGASLSLTRR